MISLATPTELAVYLQTATSDEAAAGNPNVLDTVVAEQALASASAKIRGAAGWSITEETATRTVYTWDRIFLPVMNLTSVTVTVAGVPVTEGSVFVDTQLAMVDFNPWLSPWFPRASPWFPGDGAVVTYTAGFDPVPDGPKALCLELAAGIYSNPEGDVQSVYGQVTEQHRPPATAANPEDLRVDARLAPYVVMALA